MKYTIKDDVQHGIKILRSEFIAFLYRVESAEEAQNALRKHQAEYSNATHNCYAYVLGYDAEIQYYSDAGEPGGTAGKPILNSLLRNDLSGVLAIVTRYYGGIKLGVKGLIDAYTQATTEAIALAILMEYQSYIYYSLMCDYSFLATLRHQMVTIGAMEIEVDYAEGVRMSVRVPQNQSEGFREFLDGYKALGRLDFQTEDI